MDKIAKRQTIQRVISGLLAAVGILAVSWLVVLGQYDSWPQMICGLLAVGGCYVFGYFAWRGHLPGKLLPNANAAIQRVTKRHGA